MLNAFITYTARFLFSFRLPEISKVSKFLKARSVSNIPNSSGRLFLLIFKCFRDFTWLNCEKSLPQIFGDSIVFELSSRYSKHLEFSKPSFNTPSVVVAADSKSCRLLKKVYKKKPIIRFTIYTIGKIMGFYNYNFRKLSLSFYN